MEIKELIHITLEQFRFHENCERRSKEINIELRNLMKIFVEVVLLNVNVDNVVKLFLRDRFIVGHRAG